MAAPGKLFLLPVPISDTGLFLVPASVAETARSLRHFIVENEKTARKHLKIFGYPDISGARLQVLNEHTPENEIGMLLKPLSDGYDAGLMSDAGCPAIADPGAAVVKLCHSRGIRVVPLAGPSAIMLSVMASGFSGQSFAFVGYLPVDKLQRAKRLKELETMAVRNGQAQFFIETPYRNQQMFETAVTTLQGSTRLFIGCDIGGPAEVVVSKTVRDWRAGPVPDLNKRPAVFGLFS